MQNTIVKSFNLSGVTLHSGKHSNISVHPAKANTGIIFMRKDLDAPIEECLIQSKFSNVTHSQLCTKLTNKFGHCISTIEHIMSAFHGMNIDNAIVEVDTDEIPILDGSSIDFVSNIENVGIRELDIDREIIKIQRPQILNINDSIIKAYPSDDFVIDYTIVYNHNLINEQRYVFQLNDHDNYKKLISNCRTFGFKDEVEKLKNNGLIAGGSIHNAVVLDKDGTLNQDKLRHKNEFVKHKILDFIGDIYLLGYQVRGSFEIYKGGHKLTHELMKNIMSDEANWQLIHERDFNDHNYRQAFNTKVLTASL